MPNPDLPKNDPKLHTLAGIEDMLDEMIGEMGVAVEWGRVCLGAVPPKSPKSRELSSMGSIPDIREEHGGLRLEATVTVDERAIRRFLIADARYHLKPGQRFELRRRTTNYGTTHGMCWYRNDAMDNQKTWGRVPKEPEHVPAGGYHLVGEYTVPT